MFRKVLPPAMIVLGSLGVFVLGVELFYRAFPERIPRSVEHLARARVYAFEPDIGVVLRPDLDLRVTVPRLDREVRIRTVDHGLDIGFRDDGLQGGRRIAILGDSYVFGYAVSQHESFPAKLEARMRASGVDVDVVNAGVPGFSPRLERLLLEKYLSRIDPELVLVAVFENDFEDSLYYENRRFGGLRTFLGVNSTLYQLLSAVRADLQRSPEARRDVKKEAGGARKVTPAEGSRIVQREIGRMARFCRRSGIRFAVVILPTDPPLEVRDVVPEQADFPVLDLGPRFAAAPRRDYRNPYVGHLTPAANGWVAEDIQGFIEAEALLSGMAPARSAETRRPE